MAHFNWDHLKEKLGFDSYQSQVKVCHHMSILIYYILNYPKEYIFSLNKSMGFETREWLRDLELGF